MAGAVPSGPAAFISFAVGAFGSTGAGSGVGVAFGSTGAGVGAGPGVGVAFGSATGAGSSALGLGSPPTTALPPAYPSS